MSSVVHGPVCPKAKGFCLALRAFGLKKSKLGPIFRFWLNFSFAWPELGLASVVL